MRLKSFYAKTMTEAMQMVREALGEDAVIVATRDEKGGAVRVTAAIDPNDFDERQYGGESFSDPVFETHRRERATSSDSWLQYDDEQDEDAVAEEITDAMLRHNVPEDVMDQILSCASVVGFGQSGVAMIAAIEHLFQFNPLPHTAHDKPMMFVGPPGSGKTLAVAKMAARGVMNGLKMGVVSTDTARAGGIEQLSAFTKLLRIGIHKANSPERLAATIAGLRDCDQILIDTSGINPFNTDDVRKLAQLIGAAQGDQYFVLSGGMDAEESGEMGRVFSTLGVHNILPSRIDMARRLGGLLSAAHHGGMNFTDASNTPKVANGLISLNPQKLSKLLMPAAYREGHIDVQDAGLAKRRMGTYQ